MEYIQLNKVFNLMRIINQIVSGIVYEEDTNVSYRGFLLKKGMRYFYK